MEMIQIFADKQRENGGFIPESIYLTYKDFDFGQKKKVSDTPTWKKYNIFERI
jgi:hypothetical protein